jgi:hypothetical protein
MELLQYDTALTELSKRDSQKAEAIERLMDFFISLKTENGQPLIFRASKTRISFFKAQRNCNADLSKKRPGEPVCRIFLTGAKDTLHLSLNISPDSNFQPESTDIFQSSYAKLPHKTVEDKVDIIIFDSRKWPEVMQRFAGLIRELGIAGA